jgi:hypothetical protein
MASLPLLSFPIRRSPLLSENSDTKTLSRAFLSAWSFRTRTRVFPIHFRFRRRPVTFRNSGSGKSNTPFLPSAFHPPDVNEMVTTIDGIPEVRSARLYIAVG